MTKHEPAQSALAAQETERRPRCERCTRPASHCVCVHIPSICHRTQVLVLQHPDEARHPLNTARLAVLGLQNAELRVGECFPELEEIIGSPGRAVLLFPAKDDALGTPQQEHVPPGATRPAPEAKQCLAHSASLLIVPDGTWRKARRIVKMNPVLDTLPRLSLPDGEPSQYRVRKAREAAAVSTIEAIVRALSMLEPEQDFQPLLTPFNVLVEQQIAAMGEDVYRRHHGGPT